MTHTLHAHINGPLVMIGFGSIGRGTLPLIERHIGFDRDQFTVIEPSGEFAHILREHGIKHLQVALTADNFDAVLKFGKTRATGGPSMRFGVAAGRITISVS